MVILSHIHSDHFDPSAQNALPKEVTIFCQPKDKGRIQSFGFSHVNDIQNEIVWNDIKIIRLAAQHGTGAVLSEMGGVSGYIFQSTAEPTVYWTGDSVLYDETYKIVDMYKPDLIITHSGGAVWGEKADLIVMDAKQTIQLCQYSKKSKVLAVHMESLDHCTISRKELQEARTTAGIAAEMLIVPKNGETITVE
jgi:L-ascorbate metabolism protein UlaG (beta-lactamase superfamily)